MNHPRSLLRRAVGAAAALVVAFEDNRVTIGGDARTATFTVAGQTTLPILLTSNATRTTGEPRPPIPGIPAPPTRPIPSIPGSRSPLTPPNPRRPPKRCRRP